MDDLITRYNYDSFIPENFEPWIRFDVSPPLGSPGPDFPLRNLEDRQEISLHQFLNKHLFTIVEFGSFT